MQTTLRTTIVTVVSLLVFAPAAQGTGRIVDLTSLYNVARTLDGQFDPAVHPDMDGDGTPDLEGQANLDTLVTVLADASHPQQAALLEIFEANEDVAGAAVGARFPNEPLVPYVACLFAVYMTIQGGGSFQGPTLTGMAGRVESMWIQFGIEGVAGDFDTRGWERSTMFGGVEQIQVTIGATNGGLVVCGQRAVLAVSPVDAIEYTWFKNGVPLQVPSSPQLVFDPVALEDSGEYYSDVECADKAIVQSPTVILDVSEAPSMPARSSLALLVTVAAFVLLAHHKFHPRTSRP